MRDPAGALALQNRKTCRKAAAPRRCQEQLTGLAGADSEPAEQGKALVSSSSRGLRHHIDGHGKIAGMDGEFESAGWHVVPQPHPTDRRPHDGISAALVDGVENPIGDPFHGISRIGPESFTRVSAPLDRPTVRLPWP